jgi:segregation and condensation protein B
MTKSLKLIIESLLFSSEKPLTIREIHSYLPETKPADIKSALEVLIYEYESLGRSFQLKEVADGYQFRSRSEYGSYILKMFQASPNRLSKAALETLAIIAYKQPILRHEIERLRGVDVGGILKTLMEKDLIKIMGRKDLPGRPLIYGTTKRFLEVFDLKDLSSLPRLKEIKALGAEEYTPTPQTEEQSQEPVEEESENTQETGPPTPALSGQGIIHEEDETGLSKTDDGSEAPEKDQPINEQEMAQVEAIKEAFVEGRQTYEDKVPGQETIEKNTQEESEPTSEN